MTIAESMQIKKTRTGFKLSINNLKIARLFLAFIKMKI